MEIRFLEKMQKRVKMCLTTSDIVIKFTIKIYFFAEEKNAFPLEFIRNIKNTNAISYYKLTTL